MDDIIALILGFGSALMLSFSKRFSAMARSCTGRCLDVLIALCSLNSLIC